MPSARAAHRKLSDYCGIFAEKTNRIGRNVGSFMQSRGLLPIRRSVDETAATRRDASGSVNGDVIRNDPPIPEIDREARENRRRRDEDRDHERVPVSAPKKHVAYPNSTYPYARTNASYVHRANETEPRRSRRREYAEADYDPMNETWGQRGGPSIFKPILRNGINHSGDERLYYSTMPRRSRTINFKDQACDSLEGRRRAYPKSLQDLTDLELDDITGYLPSSSSSRGGRREGRLENDYRRRVRDCREEDEFVFDDDYLKLCRNLSRLDGYPQGGRYEPGQVHYERECRTFGKDTVAFIYYKTCYL